MTDHQLVPAKPADVTADAGGVEYLAAHLRAARKGSRNSVTVAAGDVIGASLLLSAAFHDEPTIEAMNTLGLEATSVGNTSSTRAIRSCCGPHHPAVGKAARSRPMRPRRADLARARH